jgi:hypothetical protein
LILFEYTKLVRAFLLQSTGNKLVMPLTMGGEILYFCAYYSLELRASVIGTVPSLVLTTEELSVLYLSMMSHGVLHLRTLPGG